MQFMEFIKPGSNIDFLKWRLYAISLSILLILVCLGAYVYRGGLNYGVDFAGGILIQVSFAKPTTPDQIRPGLKAIGLGDALIQGFGDRKDKEFLIRARELAGLEPEHLGEETKKALEEIYGQGEVQITRVEMVGPKVGRDLREKALLAIFASILFMAVYISGRFEMKWGTSGLIAGALLLASYLIYMAGIGLEVMILVALGVTLVLFWLFKLRFAMGAIIALIHDALITVGFFALTGREFNLTTVAAVLTIIGYSVNDTIVIFDRIRENRGQAKRADLVKLINRSINETLSRTILTSAATLIVVVVLLFMGGGIISDFAFALTVGMIAGCYSTIFIASPILVFFEERAKQAAAPAPVTTPLAAAGPAPAAQSSPQSPRRRAGRERSRRKRRR